MTQPLERLNLQSYNFTVREFYLRDGEPTRWELNAPYQRGLVWTEEQNRNLIKSLLQGIPVGVIFSNRRGHDPMLPSFVVDGQQRISAIRAFREDRLAVPAEWFAEADRIDVALRGWVRYSNLSRSARIHFDGSTLAVSESTLPSVDAEAELYLLVNFGGVPQTEEDRERAAGIAASGGR